MSTKDEVSDACSGEAVDHKVWADKFGLLSDRLLTIHQACEDIDAVRQELHLLYAECADMFELLRASSCSPKPPAVAHTPEPAELCADDEHIFGPCKTCGMPYLASRLEIPTPDDIAWAQKVAAVSPSPPAPTPENL